MGRKSLRRGTNTETKWNGKRRERLGGGSAATLAVAVATQTLMPISHPGGFKPQNQESSAKVTQ